MTQTEILNRIDADYYCTAEVDYDPNIGAIDCGAEEFDPFSGRCLRHRDR